MSSHSVTTQSPSAQTRLREAIPNVIVFCLIGGVLYFGHHTGWKMPHMMELLGATKATPDDWCSEHLVPESTCIECQLDLLPKQKPFGFCSEHGVSECVIHHPELAQSKGKPQLPKYDTVQAIAITPRRENNSRNTMHTHRIQLASVESITKAGIDVDVVQERRMVDLISANGELTFDPTRVAHLSTRVPGTVGYVFKTVGDEVAAKEILALVDAVQVGQAKSQWVQSIVQYQLRKSTVDRLRPLEKNAAVSQRSMIEAESALQEAEISVVSSRQMLANLGFEVSEAMENGDPKTLVDDTRFLGIPAKIVDSNLADTKTANLIPIRAPYAGIVVTADIAVGEVVDTAHPLFTIVDPNRMWLLLNVRQEDAESVKRGQTVKFTPDHRSEEIAGEIAWISPAVDHQTRTTQVRILVANPDRKLQDKTFGTGRIILRDEPNAIVVPCEAIQSTSDAQFVFVRDKTYFDENSPKYFHVRQVRTGASDDRYVELLAGVLPGEVVVTKGSNVLLAQLLRSNLGEGCGCHKH